MTTQPEIKLPPLPTNVPHVTRRIQRTQVISAAEVVLEHFASEYARAAVLADRAARAETWQPIATAPNSTHEVLTLSRNKRVSVEFGTYLCHMVQAANRDEDDCFYTHWMPLPAAPTQERGADDE